MASTLVPTIIDLRHPTSAFTPVKTLSPPPHTLSEDCQTLNRAAPTIKRHHESRYTHKKPLTGSPSNSELEDSDGSESVESLGASTDTASTAGEQGSQGSNASSCSCAGEHSTLVGDLDHNHEYDVDENPSALTPAMPELDLRKMVLSGLCPTDKCAPKTVPTLALYNDRGLQLFDEITYLEEYYLTQEEINILERDSDKIVDHIPDNSVIVELGAGSLRKTVLLLNALEKKRKNIQYYALDVMLDELTKSLKSIGHFTNVKTAGLWGTYDQGLAFVNSFGPEIPKTLLWLGSSIGNLTREEAYEFIASYRKTLNVGDNWLIGIDRRNDPKDITLAYNDPKGITQEFVMNGLDHINVILGQEFIDRNKFSYAAWYNVEAGRHEAYYQVKETHQLVYKDPLDNKELVIDLAKDELINVEYSYKWSPEETTDLFEKTCFPRIGQWTSSSNRYDLHLIRNAQFYQKPLTEDTKPCPSQDEWEELWKSWDMLTMTMIQHPKMLLEKPISLRHPFLFYLGHIPTFVDIQLSRALKENFTEPANFTVIFERGIDPDVDDPTKCHAHSEVPETWPEIEAIIDYKERVRDRLRRVMNDHVGYPMTRRLARVLFMSFEHEAMHLETLFYMLVQSPNTLPPPSLYAPWQTKDSSNKEAIRIPTQRSLHPASWIAIDSKQLDKELLVLGHDDAEADDLGPKNQDLDSTFGWDNEHPRVQASPENTPSPYKIQSRQVTNGEFLAYLEATGGWKGRTPESWLIRDASSEHPICVKSVYGPVPMAIAHQWPVACANIQALGYARWLSEKETGNAESYALPTEHEVEIAYKLKRATVPRTGMENYGFRVWYPMLDEVAFDSKANASGTIQGFSGPGGLWDWTQTCFAPLDKTGFKTSKLYPGYSTDFFDGKHMVVLGGSWATHPRIAERRTFRNWYQANYMYMFVGFRLVKRC